MRLTSFEEFVELAQRGTFVPVVKEIVADLLTPVSAFLKVAEHSDYAFLLESVEGGEHVGRYSFLGKDPFLILRGREGQTTIEQAGTTSASDKPFVETLRSLMNGFRSPFVPGLPRFTGGAVGYFGYDMAAWFEPSVGRPWPGQPDADQAGFMLFDTVLAFDHVQHRILLIANARITRRRGPARAVPVRVHEDRVPRAGVGAGPVAAAPRRRAGSSPFTSNVTQEHFETMVRTAKEHIAAGDIYQVVLSQRLEPRLARTGSRCTAPSAT